MKIVDQDKLAASVGNALGDCLSSWMSEMSSHDLQVPVAGATFRFLETHEELVSKAIERATYRFLQDYGAGLLGQLGEDENG